MDDAARDRAHKHLDSICPKLPTDYTGYGGKVERWEDEEKEYPDCSCGCIWAAWLGGEFASDWLVCVKPGAPRCGLLTFEHMTGVDCFEGSDQGGFPGSKPDHA